MVTTAELVAQNEARLGLVKPRPREQPPQSPQEAIQPSSVPEQKVDPVLEQKRRELEAKKQDILSMYDETISSQLRTLEEMESKLRRIDTGLSTPRAEGVSNVSKFRSIVKGIRKNIGYLRENRDVSVARVDRDLAAVARAERSGIDYGTARRIEKREEARRDVSTISRLQKQADKGDTEAAAKLAAKNLWLRKAEFSSRVIPKYDGPTSGKSSGIYTSPLTGRPVIVREGGATRLPSVAQAKFSNKQARDLYRYPTTVVARVSQSSSSLVDSSVQRSNVVEKPDFFGASRISSWSGNLIVPALRADVADYRSRTGNNYFRRTYESVFGTRKNLALLSEGTDSQIESGIFRTYGGFSKKGFIANIKDAKQRLVSTGLGIIAKPSERLLFIGTTAAPEVATAAKAARIPGSSTVSKKWLSGFGEAISDTIAAGMTGIFIGKYKEQGTIGGAVGEAAPFVLPTIASTSIIAKRQSAKATEQAAGKILSKDVSTEIRSSTKDLSVELAARPLERIEQRAIISESKGVSKGEGTQVPILGDTQYLTYKDLQRAPASFIFDARIQQLTGTRPLSGSRAGVSAPAQTSYVESFGRGRTTAEKVQEAIQNPIRRFDVSVSDVSPGTVRQTASSADIVFTGYDMPPTSSLTTKSKPQTSKKTSSKPLGIEKTGGSVGYEPKLDFFEEFTLANRGSSITIRESPYTGARDVSVTPFVVERVTARPTTKKTFSGAAKSTSGVIDIEIPQSDGTVKIQSVKIDSEKQRQETKQESKKKTKQEQREQQLQELKQEAKNQQKDFQIYKQEIQSQGVKTRFEDAIVKFKRVGAANKRRGLFLSSKLSPAIKPLTITKQSLSQKVSPAQDVATEQITIPAQENVQDVAQDVVQDVATEQITLPKSTYRSRLFRETGFRSGREPELVAKIPKFDRDDSSRRRQSVFPVFVRRRGVFTEVGSAPSYREAVLKGATIVGTTAAASFKVGGRDPSFREGLGLLRGRFRQSKVSPNIFVEKSKFRISTPGEVAEISRKGQASQRAKKKKKGFFGGFHNGIFK